MTSFNIDPAQYDAQLAAKLSRFKADFADLALPEPAVFASPPLHYRMRAEFRLWHHDGRIDYAMFEGSGQARKVVLIEDFPIAAAPIAQLMAPLRDYLQQRECLHRGLFQLDFLATLSGELLLTLIYHRPLDEDWQAEAAALAEHFGILLIGRSRKQKIVLERDWVLEKLQVGDRRLRYQQIEGSFTQPNAQVNQHMLAWAAAQAAGIGGDLLELYCGNGNFTLALAPAFERVLATEVSKTSVQAAHYNLDANQIDNVRIVRMASEEISDALAGGRQYRRLDGIELADYRFTTLFVDPPRSGLDAGTLALARDFEHILYISCNPTTLHDNLLSLQESHHIVASAIFDQFPYTPHLESGVLLKRK